MDQRLPEAPGTVETIPEGVRREPPPPALIPGWRCLPRALIRANGEEGYVDLAALHPARGVALVALLEPDEEASPEAARTALRAMLEQQEFEKRFPGELPVVALVHRRAAAERLAAAVEDAFAGLTRPGVAEGWIDWLAERMLPAAAAAAAPPALVVPPREEPAPERPAEVLLLAPPREEVLPASEAAAIAPPAEAPPQSAPARAGVLDWGASLGFAAGIVLALLVGMVLLSHAVRLF